MAVFRESDELSSSEQHEDDQIKTFAREIASRLIGSEGITPPAKDETVEINISRIKHADYGKAPQVIERLSIRQSGNPASDGMLPTEIGLDSPVIGRVDAQSHRLQLQIPENAGPNVRAELILREPSLSTYADNPLVKGLSALNKLQGIFNRRVFRSLPSSRSKGEFSINDPDTLIQTIEPATPAKAGDDEHTVIFVPGRRQPDGTLEPL